MEMHYFRLMFALLFVILNQPELAHAQTGPSFCTYSDNYFTCNYASMGSGNRPIDFSQFSVQPQQLKLSVNGYLPYSGDTQTFSSTFNSMDPSQFDANFPARLEIDCGRSGSIYVNTGAFYNISHVQHLKFKNCFVVYMIAYGLSDLQQLDYLGFEGGTIDSIDPNAMAGVDVEKTTYDVNLIPRFRGQFEMIDCKMYSQTIPPGLMFSWKNLTSATLKAAGINTLSSDSFRYNTNIRYIDLSDNDFTSLPSGFFDSLDKLGDVTIYNNDWDCTCANLWFVPYAVSNNITLFGDFMCTNPQGTTVNKFYYSSCVTSSVCDGYTGVDTGDKCITAVAIASIFIAFLGFAIIMVAMVLAILTMKRLKESDQESSDESENTTNNDGNHLGTGQHTRTKFKEWSRNASGV